MANLQDISAAHRFVAVTPSASVNFTETPRAIYVGVTGDIAAVGPDDVAVVFKAVPVGVLPIQPKRINVSGTTATDMVALY